LEAILSFFSIADGELSQQQQKWFCFYFMTGQHESQDISTAFSRHFHHDKLFFL
jgi:hypothetical protein